jgi:Sulfotransferase domain
MTCRIAMWSGPRNISTAMMRAWESRPDCAVVDEPLYAAYLHETGLEHPMRDAVLASQPRDWRQAVEAITEAPCVAAIQYQKHMVHHLLPSMDFDWLGELRHAFLIREPARVVASYAARRGSPTMDDLGFAQQAALYDRLASLGQAPPVLLAADVIAAPRRALVALCDALELPFDEAMLGWRAGPRDSDGIWGAHWYDAVYRSTRWQAPSEAAPVVLEGALDELARACQPYFEHLLAKRLVIR